MRDGGYLPNGLDFVSWAISRRWRPPLDFLGVNYYTREVVRDEEARFNQPAVVQPAPPEHGDGLGDLSRRPLPTALSLPL
ncbi:MAG: hypothetical protein R2851_19430 [Caldilineaceae bacterium]